MFPAAELERRIVEAMPDAEVRVQDLTGGGDHYRVEIVASAFEGQPALKRHRMVYGLFEDVLGGALHALSLDTRAPGE
jgi:stress-induced morphogen